MSLALWQRYFLLIVAKLFPPVCQRLLLVLLLKPLNIFTIWLYRRELRSLLPFQAAIYAEQLIDNNSETPAIHQNMMMAPYHLEFFRSQAEYKDAGRDIARQVEARLTILLLSSFKSCFLRLSG
ncbi:hypothetical protein D3C78_812980 [compost metagenome]